MLLYRLTTIQDSRFILAHVLRGVKGNVITELGSCQSLSWVTLQNLRDVPANTKLSAEHIPYINLKFYIINEMLMLNLYCLPQVSFRFQLLLLLLFCRPKLWCFYFILLYSNSLSALLANKFLFFFQPQFCSLQLVFPFKFDLIFKGTYPFMKSSILDLCEPISCEVLQGPYFIFVPAHILRGVAGTISYICASPYLARCYRDHI
jgi:hypothetical protein